MPTYQVIIEQKTSDKTNRRKIHVESPSSSEAYDVPLEDNEMVLDVSRITRPDPSFAENTVHIF
jgi:hypothetical protein